MSETLVQKWNKEHERIPKDKDPSIYAEQISHNFAEGSLIADIGSGTGADAIYFLEQGMKVIAVDISPFALAETAKKAEALGYEIDTRQVVVGAEPLPIDENSLDGIYSRLALHYFNGETTKSVLRELYDKLKPGGKAFITIKSPKDSKEIEFLKQTAREIEPGVFDDQGQVKNRFTLEQLRKMLQDAGIDSAEVAEYIEDLSGRNDVTKSGNQQLLLNEIKFAKP